MYPDGTILDRHGAIVGSADEKGGFTPVTAQEELDYRRWRISGGEASFAVWENNGKSSEIEAGRAKNAE